jgi:hypothetical protein
MKHIKTFKNGRVLYLALKLTLHVIKNQINLVRQYFKWYKITLPTIHKLLKG